jgi:hypothetical protein
MPMILPIYRTGMLMPEHSTFRGSLLCIKLLMLRMVDAWTVKNGTMVDRACNFLKQDNTHRCMQVSL